MYDEAGLQRLDLILAEAAKNNIRVIFPLVNVWPDLGGMQWWVDQVCRGLQPLSKPLLFGGSLLTVRMPNIN